MDALRCEEDGLEGHDGIYPLKRIEDFFPLSVDLRGSWAP